MNDSPPTDRELSSLAQLGNDLYEAEADVLRLDAELKRAKAKRDRIQHDLIPEAMAEIGVLEFRTATSHIKVEEKLRVQPLKQNRPLVLQAVEEMGSGNLIKTTVSVPFNRGEDDRVEAALLALEEMGCQYKQERDIHPSTLRKFVSDLLKEGKPVDMELFGARKFKQAVFEDGAPEPPVFEDED